MQALGYLPLILLFLYYDNIIIILKRETAKSQVIILLFKCFSINKLHICIILGSGV